MISLNHFIQEAELKNIQYSEITRNDKIRTIFYKNDKQYIVTSVHDVVVYVIETVNGGKITTSVLEEYAEDNSYPESYYSISLLDMFKRFCE